MKIKNKTDWPHAVQIWLERVDYDLETARAMYKAGRYLYVVFMCQQAIEKNIKAMLAMQGKEIRPIHNLSKLAEDANVLQELDKETQKFIDMLSHYYLNARYKETIAALSQTIGKKEAKEYLEKAKRLTLWLTQKMKPSK
jgi:HEPN domain-containing protein